LGCRRGTRREQQGHTPKLRLNGIELVLDVTEALYDGGQGYFHACDPGRHFRLWVTGPIIVHKGR
jgi:hypothetical protein